MRAFIFMALFCSSLVGFAADLKPISNPRLPEAQGSLQGNQEESIACILGLLKPVLADGQAIYWLNGANLVRSTPNAAGKTYADYKVFTKLPAAKYLLRLTAEQESGWTQYVYGNPPLIHIGAQASGLKRIADFFAINGDGSFAASTEIDLTPCERTLSTQAP